MDWKSFFRASLSLRAASLSLIARGRLIDLARERAVTLCTSTALLAELAEVIGRGKFTARIHDAGISAAELVEDYARLAEIVRLRFPDRSAAIPTTISC